MLSTAARDSRWAGRYRVPYPRGGSARRFRPRRWPARRRGPPGHVQQALASARQRAWSRAGAGGETRLPGGPGRRPRGCRDQQAVSMHPGQVQGGGVDAATRAKARSRGVRRPSAKARISSCPWPCWTPGRAAPGAAVSRAEGIFMPFQRATGSCGLSPICASQCTLPSIGSRAVRYNHGADMLPGGTANDCRSLKYADRFMEPFAVPRFSNAAYRYFLPRI